MSRQIQLRRGTTAENNTFTGAQGELVVDTDLHQLVLHDGATAGGHRIIGPQGNIGNQGLQGNIGPKGDTGVNGNSAYEVAVINGFSGNEVTWLATLVGPQGNVGNQGNIGNQGIQGNIGHTGANGNSAYEVAVINGFSGDEVTWLATLVGPKGDTGIQGNVGDQGNIGPKGDTGINGQSAYEIAVFHGFSDTETVWLTTLVGAQGNVGNQGNIGPKGDTGSTGPQGLGWRTVPSSSIGQAGDTTGDAAIDTTYMYYCTAPYDGATPIWYRQALTGATW